jgi:hypothetical protein
MLNASQMAASNLLEGEEDEYGNPKYDKAAINASGVAVQNKYDEIYNDLYGSDGSDGTIAKQYNKADNRSDIGSHGADDVLIRYEEAIGENLNWAANTIRGNDANREFVYMEGGDEKTLTPEDIAMAIAAYESTKDANLAKGAAEAVQSVIKELAGNKTGLNAVTAISNGGESADMAGFFSEMTESELSKINEAFKDGAKIDEVAAALGMSEEQLSTVLEQFGIDFDTFA